MIERHYDDDALATILVSEGDRPDAHLQKCRECADKLESFQLVTSALRDAATWDKREVDEAPNPHTIALLRSFATTAAAEDARAAECLTDLLAGARETWREKLAAHPEYRTAGMVRQLIAATDRALDTMPLEALEITALSTDIAEGLDPAAYEGDTVAHLRGAAWRDRAYALFYTGWFADAEHAVDVADRHLAGCVVNEYDAARVGIVRALVERGLEKYEPAIESARRSAGTFEAFGDARRRTSARLAEVHLLFSRREFIPAVAILTELEQAVRGTDDAANHATILGNLGYGSFKLGKAGDALRYHQAAADLFEQLGRQTDAARVRWNITSVMASEGYIAEAMERFEQLCGDFTRFGMSRAATEAALEFAELLLTRGEDFDLVEQICRGAVRSLEAAGLTHTSPAFTALALMHEAAQNRTATAAMARMVRDDFRRLPDEQQFLFAPPPL